MNLFLFIYLLKFGIYLLFILMIFFSGKYIHALSERIHIFLRIYILTPCELIELWIDLITKSNYCITIALLFFISNFQLHRTSQVQFLFYRNNLLIDTTLFYHKMFRSLAYTSPLPLRFTHCIQILSYFWFYITPEYQFITTQFSYSVYSQIQ